MIEIELDGKKVEITEGSMIMHAADKAGTYIPHFCYHKKLSIAANCRMCLVDVEKAPKPMPACATPVTNGMIVRTKSDKAIKAQQSVMEFLLINHPLDCPICDQGGECQLQDLAVGYGGSSSRYEEEKRVVLHKDVGPLISMEEMSRCIHCTRCVRFGQEVAGVMELGMIHRGEHSEITTVLERHGRLRSLRQHDRPVPGRRAHQQAVPLQARTWELSRRKSVSPHDSTGANLIVQVKNNKVMRVLPLENDEVNECWLADRDRFSYEALNDDDRLTAAHAQAGRRVEDGRLADRARVRGQWPEADQGRARRAKHRRPGQPAQHGGRAVPGRRADAWPGQREHRLSPAQRGVRQAIEGVRWLGTSIASLSNLQRALVIGSNLRKDHPLFALRVRAAVRKGAAVSVIHDVANDWAMPIASSVITPASNWVQALADVAAAIAAEKGVSAPAAGRRDRCGQGDRESLLGGERKAILLGNAAAHHAQRFQPAGAGQLDR